MSVEPTNQIGVMRRCSARGTPKERPDRSQQTRRMGLRRRIRAFVVAQIILYPTIVVSAPCTVCQEEEDEILTKPNTSLSIPGFEFMENCATLHRTIPEVLQDDAIDCTRIRAYGKISCGCISTTENNNEPTTTTTTTATKTIVSTRRRRTRMNEAARKPCQLCPTPRGVLFPNRTIDVSGISTCRQLEDVIALALDADTPDCRDAQSIVGLCGCDTLPQNPCTMCRDGSSVPQELFHKTIPFIPSTSNSRFAPNATTCGLYEAFLKSIDAKDAQCPLSQGIGSYCGCPPVENHCEFCPMHPIDPAYYDKTLHFLSQVRQAGIDPTCEFAETLLKQVPSSDRLQCYGTQQRAFLCGCNDGVWLYANTRNNAMKLALAWAPRVTGTLSLLVRPCGSLLLLLLLWSFMHKQKSGFLASLSFCRLVSLTYAGLARVLCL